jgi:hypothetical protein
MKMAKPKPVLDRFMEATYVITDNSEDYLTLSSIREWYEAYCASNTIVPMHNSIFLQVLLNRYPQLGLTSILIEEEDTTIITRIKYK